ncbi:MAG: endopeptidase La [Patescibacteria group bacterium]|nr:endopeptidase La [Patescibacteria group bacterium]
MTSESIILPLGDLVIFPEANATIFLDQNGVDAIKFANETNRDIAIFLRKDEKAERLSITRQLHEIGTVVRVVKIASPTEQGQIRVLVEGATRVRLNRLIQTRPYLVGEIETIDEIKELDIDDKVIANELKAIFIEYIKLSSPLFPKEIILEIEDELDPTRIINTIGIFASLGTSAQQQLLNEIDLAKALKLAYGMVDHKLRVEQIRRSIKEKLGHKLSEQEKSYVLREELKVIQKELKKSDKKATDGDPEITELRDKLKAGNYPEIVIKTIEQQLDRLSKQHQSSPDYAMQRDYIDWLMALPWLQSTKEKISLKRAEKVLSENHYGLDEAKERILEFLAVRKLADKTGGDGAILCFVGPPGVGKTSLGNSIADALNRKFVHFSLGGMRDEAEIRGHRRTYIGAMPGRIIQRLKRVGVNNPVFMLDEVDKIGNDFRGDPASALLEVLDPEQNKEFNDHYIDLPFDLSNCFFITTANELDPIPSPLRDRMEIIRFSGYTEQEKLKIAKKHIIPKALKQHGLTRRRVEIGDDAMLSIIRHYTAEAGLRNLEREIRKICRKIAKEIIDSSISNLRISAKNLEKYLGPQQHHIEKTNKFDRPGISTGLAWTPVGGEILFIESVKIQGKGGLKLTGQLGEVMRESVSAAFSFLKSNAEKFDIDPKTFSKHDVHVHVPAGAIPKDGPSAGITIFAALLSLFKGQKVPENIAMTGEISLTGRVLKIGGLKEKVLGALRAGIDTIIIPMENKQDLVKIDKEILKKLTFKFVERADEVAEIVIGKKVQKKDLSK